MKRLAAFAVVVLLVTAPTQAQSPPQYAFIPQYTTAELPTCDSDHTHRIILDTTVQRFKTCNGSSWIFTTEASGIGTCATNTWASTLNNSATPTCTQPGMSQLSDDLSCTGSQVVRRNSGDTAWECATIGSTTPTGTGFRHVTAGSEDAAAKLVDTADINASQVTYAKIQNLSAISRILGRGSAAGVGAPEEITLGANLSMTGTVLSASAGAGNFLAVDVDFGANGNTNASTTVTGQTWVTGGSIVICSPTMVATASRAEGAEDAILEGLMLAVHSRVVGTGFTLSVSTQIGRAYGVFTFHCTGA